jgi:hypothetical protein
MTADTESQNADTTPDVAQVAMARVALAVHEPLPAMVYRSEAFAEDLDLGLPRERPRSGALRAGLARIWATVPLGIALAAGVGLPWTLPH